MRLKSALFWCIFSFLLTVLFVPIVGSQGLKSSSDQEHKFEINLDLGYFFPLRGGFREYYGSDLRYGGGISYNILEKIGVGADFSYTKLKKSEYPVKFKMYALVPFLAWKPLREDEHLYLGGGLGYYDANVTLLVERTEYKQKNKGVGLIGFVGLKIGVSDAILLKLEGRMDHTFLGNPQIGDFGNVGGLNLIGKVGITF